MLHFHLNGRREGFCFHVRPSDGVISDRTWMPHSCQSVHDKFLAKMEKGQPKLPPSADVVHIRPQPKCNVRCAATNRRPTGAVDISDWQRAISEEFLGSLSPQITGSDINVHFFCLTTLSGGSEAGRGSLFTVEKKIKKGGVEGGETWLIFEHRTHLYCGSKYRRATRLFPGKETEPSLPVSATTSHAVAGVFLVDLHDSAAASPPSP